VPILHEHIEGKYEILGKLREGGMGAVYKVRHRLLDDIRVVKVLNPRLDVTPELSDRFLREARFAIQLRHPNIAQLHDFSIAEDGSAFIVMEFIDGATLEDIIIRTGAPPLGLGLGLEMARQSLKALGFLHRRGLIHRDISPDNLMLARDAEGEPLVKLIDLGIAKVLKGGTGQLTSTGMFLGKPRYASPEQFSAAGLEGVDARADLYSFGVVLYELLTGVCPIQGRDPGSLMAGHLFRPPVDFAESDPQARLPEDLRAILLRVLAKAPGERFTSAEELSRSLGVVQDRYPRELEELEAALRTTALPESPTPAPGTTQNRLDQRFAMVPTPAPTESSEPHRETTLVLSPPDLGSFQEKADPEVTHDPTPPVAAETVSISPKVAALPQPAPRMEVPKPTPRGSVPERRSDRNWDVVAALLVLGLAMVGLGFWWWRASRPTQVEPPPLLAASAPKIDTPVVSTTPSVTPPEAQPTPSFMAHPPAPPKPEPTPVRELPVEKTVRQPDMDETGGRAVVDPVSIPSTPTRPEAPQPVAQSEQNPLLPEPEAPAPSSQAPQSIPTPPSIAVPDRHSEELVDPSQPTVDTRARLVSLPSPSLPAIYKEPDTYARAVVAVKISEYGRVTETRIKDFYTEISARASDSVLREAALQAAGKAVFQPAQRGGKPVPSWTALMFQWGKRSGSVTAEGAASAKLIYSPRPSYVNLDAPAVIYVEVKVDEQGKVEKAQINRISGSASEGLREAVVKAALRALFKPAGRFGAWYVLKFQLDPKP
jgi:serine/threonine protein kinase